MIMFIQRRFYVNQRICGINIYSACSGVVVQINGCWKVKSVALTSIYRQKPVLPIIAKHLTEVGIPVDIVGMLIGSTNGKSGCPRGFQCGAIDEHQVNVIEKQTDQTEGKYDRCEEQEEYVEVNFSPEVLKEISQRCRGNIYTHDQCIAHEQHKVFVIVEVNTIVHPNAMMIHFQHTTSADSAMMRSIRLDDLAFLAESHRAALGSIFDL